MQIFIDTNLWIEDTKRLQLRLFQDVKVHSGTMTKQWLKLDTNLKRADVNNWLPKEGSGKKKSSAERVMCTHPRRLTFLEHQKMLSEQKKKKKKVLSQPGLWHHSCLSIPSGSTSTISKEKNTNGLTHEITQNYQIQEKFLIISLQLHPNV